jgi:DNA-binding NarL/FixJ family response regulator
MSIRLVLGEDNALLREGMRGLLSMSEDIEVVASCADLPTLIESVDALRPDVVLTDIRMPPSWTDEGVQIARHCRAHHPDTGVVLLSQYVDPGYVRSLLDSGSAGRGYLLKERVSDLAELTDAVRRVALGGLVIDPSVVAQLVGRKRTRNPLDDLTERERQVLTVMAEGRSNQAICQQLYLSPKTVEAYVRGVFTKLGLHQGADDNRRVLAVLTFLRG